MKLRIFIQGNDNPSLFIDCFDVELGPRDQDITTEEMFADRLSDYIHQRFTVSYDEEVA